MQPNTVGAVVLMRLRPPSDDAFAGLALFLLIVFGVPTIWRLIHWLAN